MLSSGHTKHLTRSLRADFISKKIKQFGDLMDPTSSHFSLPVVLYFHINSLNYSFQQRS